MAATCWLWAMSRAFRCAAGGPGLQIYSHTCQVGRAGTHQRCLPLPCWCTSLDQSMTWLSAAGAAHKPATGCVMLMVQVWDALQNNLLYVWKLPRSEVPSPHHADFVSSLCFNLAADGSVQLCAGCSNGVIQVGAGHAALIIHTHPAMHGCTVAASKHSTRPRHQAVHTLYCAVNCCCSKLQSSGAVTVWCKCGSRTNMCNSGCSYYYQHFTGSGARLIALSAAQQGS